MPNSKMAQYKGQHLPGLYMSKKDCTSASLAYQQATARWELAHPTATPQEREEVNSHLFCEIMLGRKQMDGFCRTCARIHQMTVIPMESDPSVFRIECRCCGTKDNS